jgi:hypothetical protein
MGASSAGSYEVTPPGRSRAFDAAHRADGSTQRQQPTRQAYGESDPAGDATPILTGLWHKAIHSKGGPEARGHLAPVGGILARSDHPAASAPWPRIVVFAGVVVDYGLGPSDSSCSSSKLPSPFERQEFII